MHDPLIEAFARRFGGPPTHRVTSPGRVNLIGEHVDYAGLPVLPMAIARGITLAVRPRPDTRVRILNADTGLGEREFEVSDEIIPFGPGDWGNYPKAALQGLARAGYRVRGFDAMLASDLPAAAGLSSSSSLVVATALAGLADDDSAAAASDEPANAGSLKLAAVLADAEHYVGARGGGMDQAVIVAGRARHALLIRFDPLGVRPLPVPDDWRFVVAHSLVGAEKSAGARELYNARRAEVERGFAVLGGPAAHLLAARDVEELLADAASMLPAGPATRVRHVLTEHDRVTRAVAAMQTGDACEFGRLMLASHASLRDDFGVSTPALDELVEVAGRSGALGARLTGAGLGGCIVALVERGGEDALLAGLRARYYGPRGVIEEAVGLPSTLRPLFTARSADGARISAI